MQLRRSKASLAFVTLAVALAAGACNGDGDGDDGGNGGTSAATTTTAARPATTTTAPEAAAACERPAFAPDRLPWSAAVGEPDENIVEDGARIVVWNAPGGDGSVSLRRGATPMPTPTQSSDRGTVRGHDALLVEVGDPGTGERTIHWQEGDAPCDRYTLGVVSAQRTDVWQVAPDGAAS